MNYGVAVAAELRFYLIYAITNVTSGCCCEANPQTQSPRAARRSVAQSIARWFVNLHLAKKHFAFHLRCGVLSQKNTSKFCVCFVSENNKTGACESEFTHNEWRRWTSCYAQIQLKQQYVKRIMVCCKLVSSLFLLFFASECSRWCVFVQCTRQSGPLREFRGFRDFRALSTCACVNILTTKNLRRQWRHIKLTSISHPMYWISNYMRFAMYLCEF